MQQYAATIIDTSANRGSVGYIRPNKNCIGNRWWLIFFGFTSDGTVWATGENSSGEIDLPLHTVYREWTNTGMTYVSKIACGGNHSLLISVDKFGLQGKIVMANWNFLTEMTGIDLCNSHNFMFTLAAIPIIKDPKCACQNNLVILVLPFKQIPALAAILGTYQHWDTPAAAP